VSKAEREELIQLRREVSEYEVEFRNLKNQDITIRKLEAKIQEMQLSSEEQLKEQVEKAKEEFIESEGRRASEALEREAAMERRVQTLELQLKAERAGREATQEHLLQADEGVSQREAAWEAQKTILVDETTRLREMLHVTSTERDELKLKVAAIEGKNSKLAISPPPSGNAVSVKDLMLERKAYEAEV
jgi:homeobox protein cut-like